MTELKVGEKDGAATLDILVQPRCSREGVGPVVGDRLKVSVNAPPVDGKANEAMQRVLAETFGVPRSAVTILRGETGKRKTDRWGAPGIERTAQPRAIMGMISAASKKIPPSVPPALGRLPCSWATAMPCWTRGSGALAGVAARSEWGDHRPHDNQTAYRAFVPAGGLPRCLRRRESGHQPTGCFHHYGRHRRLCRNGRESGRSRKWRRKWRPVVHGHQRRTRRLRSRR
jgi:hypothetical protein